MIKRSLNPGFFARFAIYALFRSILIRYELAFSDRFYPSSNSMKSNRLHSVFRAKPAFLDLYVNEKSSNAI